MPAWWDETADGLRYVRCRYAGEDDAAMRATIDECARLLLGAPRPVGVLIEGRGFRPTPRVLGYAKTVNRDVFGPRRSVAALTVADALHRTLVNGFNNVGGGSRVRAVRTEDEAFDWIRRHLAADFD